MYDHILIRYGELSLKGRNQIRFLRKLVKNIDEILEYSLGEKVETTIERGRVFIKLNGKDPEIFYEPLSKVFGIFSFSPVKKIELDIDVIKEAALNELLALPEKPKTFRVIARRANKRFPIQSPQAQKDVGAYVLKNIEGLKVDLHNPDAKIFLEIRNEAAYVYSLIIKGLGGLPLGTGGKAMLLLSGGIDSPVAGWLTMKRGVIVEAVHFYSYPYTSERAKEKVLDLAKVLAQYSGEVKVHIIPFTKIQETISTKCNERLWITIMRRFMLRIAHRVAEKRRALALVTGESIGQVASQTIESMNAINHVTNIPVIRPLITSDKEDIMNLARKIDTYDISIRPYEDCCTVFLPKEPKTKPNVSACLKEEEVLEVDALIEDALDGIESISLKRQVEKDEFGYF